MSGLRHVKSARPWQHPDSEVYETAGPNGQAPGHSELRAILQFHVRSRLEDDGRILAEAHEKLVGIGCLGERKRQEDSVRQPLLRQGTGMPFSFLHVLVVKR